MYAFEPETEPQTRDLAHDLEAQWDDLVLMDEIPTPAQYAEQCTGCPYFRNGCTVEDCPYDAN